MVATDDIPSVESARANCKSPLVTTAHVRALELIGLAQDQLAKAVYAWALFPDDYLDSEAWVRNDYQELIVRMPPHRSPAGAALFALSYLSELLAGVVPDLRKDSWQLESDEVYMRLRRCILTLGHYVDSYERACSSTTSQVA